VERTPVTPSLRSRAGSEPLCFAQGKLRERFGSPDAQILRYAQDDSLDTAQSSPLMGSLLSTCLICTWTSCERKMLKKHLLYRKIYFYFLVIVDEII